MDFFRPVENHGPPYEVGLGENQWPSTPEDFRNVSEAYVDSVISLGISVTSAIALALGVQEDLFTSRIDHGFWNLRVLKYAATDENDNEPKVSGIGEHTGHKSRCYLYPLLTVYDRFWNLDLSLLTDPQKNSLQVLSKSGEWIPAVPIPVSLPNQQLQVNY